MDIFAIICFAAALFFSCAYGTVYPLLKAVRRRSNRYSAKNKELTADLANTRRRIVALESVCVEFEKELVRVDSIRKRTDEKYTEHRRRWEDGQQERRAA